MFLATLATAAISFLISRRSVPDGEFRIVGNRIWLGEHRLPMSHSMWSRETRAKVVRGLELSRTPRPLGKLQLVSSKANSFLVGVDRRFCIDEGAGHLLVIGPTGSGKSELIHLVLASLSANVEIAIADYKGGAVLTELSGVGRQTSDIESIDHQKEFWNSLSEELVRREQWLRNHGVANWSKAEQLSFAEPRLLVVIDEVVAAIRNLPLANDVLTRIATKGRSLGVHLLVTSQSLIGIPREVLINLRARLALSGTDEVELMQLGCKERIGSSSAQTKAAVLLHDGQTFSVAVPLGIRREPRSSS